MSTKPLVSIVMPVKNTSLYLGECLDSILAQIYSNWELLVVDDHSTDDSYKILTQYAEKDDRIKVLTNKGSGIIAALQLAYSNTKGNYITRMDSDDIMEPIKLSLMIEQLQEKGRGYLAVGLVNYFGAHQVGQGYLKYATWLNELTISVSNFKDIYKECSIPSPCWMVKRTDFEACGGFNSEIYPEDYDLAFRFRKGRLKIAPVPAIIHQWRDYETRTSRTDAHYADNNFAALKVMHFLDQDYNPTEPLLLWGAGKKGKKLAQLFIDQDVDIQWITDNDNKIGRDIYGVVLQGMDVLSQRKNVQVIIAISSPDDSDFINEVTRENSTQTYFRFY